MTIILQTAIWDTLSAKQIWISIKIALFLFVSNIQIGIMPPFVPEIAWHRTGDKTLFWLLIDQFSDACMRHSTRMGEK